MKIKSKQLLQIIILFLILILLSAFVKAESEKAELISINLKEVELETALIMLANTAHKNLICDSSVAGKITVIFNDIIFEDALNLITDSFNLDYKYQKNIIYVSTAKKMKSQNNSYLSKKIKFRNLNSETAAEILKKNFEDIK